MNKPILISLAITAVLIGWALWVAGGNPGTNSGSGTTTVPTAVMVDGKQVIDITAKGGYSPRVVEAKAGVPTVLRVNTNGTFDCSSSLVIPSLGYQKFLKSSGTEEIAISADKAQGTLQGLCSMGMYGFQIKFQ